MFSGDSSPLSELAIVFGSLVSVIEENDVTASARRTGFLETSVRRQILVVLILVGLAIGVVVGALFGVSRTIWNMSESTTAEWGTCHGVVHVTCINLPLHTIERDSGIILPAGTKIVSSESTGPNMFQEGSIRAELLLPPGVASPLAAQMGKDRDTYSADWDRVSGLDELKARGLQNVQGLADPPRSFVQGQRKDGRISMIVLADDPHH